MADINDIIYIQVHDHPAGQWNGNLARVVRLSVTEDTMWIKPAINSPIYRMKPNEVSIAQQYVVPKGPTVVAAAAISITAQPLPAAVVNRSPESEIDGGPSPTPVVINAVPSVTTSTV